ncbi:hypothetical protein HRbin39_01762 [bacterium HR39]|nr:hypothetical protein HRbin39_01762 [bacterium HR39]
MAAEERQGIEKDWALAVKGDRDAFNRVVDPLVPELIEAARHELAFFVETGDLPADATTPEEVVGEVMLRAWRNRRRRLLRVSVEAWLLAILYRVIDETVHAERRRRELAETARDMHPEVPPLEDEDAFWEWFQPEDLPVAEPLIPEPAPDPETVTETLEARPRVLATTARRALMMHRRHRLAVKEIAAVLRRPVGETVEIIREAARRVREQKAKG